MSEKLVLLDGHSILNRAFYGIPDLTNSAGLHTNAVYGFLSIMFKVLETEKPQYLAVAFDVKAPTFRHRLYDAYKGTRKGMPEELHAQVPVMKEVLHAMGIVTVEQAGLEADDLLGSLARQAEEKGMEVTIVSGDRDLLQLATEKVKIHLAKPVRGGSEGEEYYAEDVLAKYGVTPKEFIEVKALMGDTSDNIPGLPGVGEKTAVKIIAQYKTIENAYANLEEIKPNKAREAFRNEFDSAKLSKVLATIDTGCLPDFSFASAQLKDLYTPEAYKLFKQLEFKQFLSRFTPADDKTMQKRSVTAIDTEEQAQSFLKNLTGKRIGISIYQRASQMPVSLCAFAVEDQVYLLKNRGFSPERFARLMGEAVTGAGEVCTFSVKDLKRGMLATGCPEELVWNETEKTDYFDVHLAAYLLNPLKSSYAYDDISEEYLQESLPSPKELLGKVKWEQVFEKAPEALERILVCESGTVLDGKEILREKLEENNMWKLYREMELPLADVLLRMELYGIQAQAARLIEYSQVLQQRIEELEHAIYEQAGETFNINSPKQLGDILFSKMQLKGSKKTKTGYSTAADVLEKLAGKYPIVADILEYRQLTKLKSTYADGLVAFIGSDGRIHSTFHQSITATGRISSAEPNLQNIPVRTELGRQIRKVFVPAEGYVFVDADYSQIELRVLAHMSGDQRLIEAYRQEEDIHKSTAAQVFHVPLEEVTSQQRRNAKAVNFGIVYGISSFGLSQDLSISWKEAQEYIERYFETYPKIKGFLDGLVSDAKKTGYTYTIYDRRRPVPELSSGNFMQRSFGERIAMNSPIQGTAADIIKIAMLRVDKRLRREKLRSRLILQVHDELLIEAWQEEAEQVRRILKEEMEQAADLLVPLVVEVNTGSSWYDTK